MQPEDNKNQPENAQGNVLNLPVRPLVLSLTGDKKIQVSIPDDVAVILAKEAFEQLFGWAYATSLEISCLGSVNRQGNRFFIEKFFLLRQSGSFGQTELDPDAVEELMERLLADGKSQEAQSLKCWAHSHPGMDVFWSTTDEHTCQLLASDYLVSLVVSSNFAIRCRIDSASPFPVSFDQVPVFYEMPEDAQSMRKYAEEVRSVVVERISRMPGNDNTNPEKKDVFDSVFYCEFCGNFHGVGECPVEDMYMMPGMDDGSGLLF
jgi:proteasome lid subunit RPN8/RPN11